MGETTCCYDATASFDDDVLNDFVACKKATLSLSSGVHEILQVTFY